jgi:N-acetylglutamate synthase/N-acetylornithine aminotransferase
MVTYSWERSEKKTSASAPSPGSPIVYSTSGPATASSSAPRSNGIAAAVGAVLYDASPLPLDIWIEGVQVCARGAAVPHHKAALAEAVAGEEVEYTVGLPGVGADAEVFFSDLSHEYVRINAEYTT